MQNLTAKKIISFRRLPKSRKLTFVNNLKKPVVKSDSGGDYWISCISAITRACKENKNKFVEDKIDFLLVEQKGTSNKRTKDMYQRNIDILTSFRSYDFKKLKPKKFTEFETKPNTKFLLSIKGFSIQVLPNHVFTYKNEQTDEVGAVWFVAQLDGFKAEELEIFCELLYKYLSLNYSKKHSINANFCVVVDVVSLKEMRFSKIEDSGMGSILSSTLSELRTYVK